MRSIATLRRFIFEPPYLFRRRSNRRPAQQYVAGDSTFFSWSLAQDHFRCWTHPGYFLDVFAAVAVELPLRKGVLFISESPSEESLELSFGVAFFAIEQQADDDNTTKKSAVKHSFLFGEISTYKQCSSTASPPRRHRACTKFTVFVGEYALFTSGQDSVGIAFS